MAGGSGSDGGEESGEGGRLGSKCRGGNDGVHVRLAALLATITE